MTLDSIWIWFINSTSVAAFLAFLLFLSKKLIVDYFSRSVAHSFDQKLEEAKSDLAAQEQEIEFIRSHLKELRSKRSEALQVKQFDAAEQIFRVIQTLRKMTMAVEMLKLFDIEKMKLQMQDNDISELFDTLQKGLKIDESISELSQHDTGLLELYLDEATLMNFNGYKSIMTFGAMVLRCASLNIPIGKVMDNEKIVEEMKALLPHSADSFDKWGARYSLYWQQYFLEQTISSLRAMVSLEQDAKKDVQYLAKASMDAKQAQAQVKSLLANTGLGEGILDDLSAK